MTYEQLQNQQSSILLDCISGSRAYNLNLPNSDTDKKGVFIMPQSELYGFTYQDQVANTSNDEVYFEIKRFIDLLVKNNPGILELLNTPAQFVIARHAIMDIIKPKEFISKMCFDTFAGYAQTQIKKAKGLNKKINIPMEAERKSIFDFCFVIHDNGSISLSTWLKERSLLQEDCGLVNLPHFRNVYLLYHKSQLKENGFFKGIISGLASDDVLLSSVPKGIMPLGTMTFNKDSYSVYSKNYKEYKEWEVNRNQVRFESTLLHGKNYDAKNMMHIFRLLNMAEEIAISGEVIVYRNDRNFLLEIRAGEYEFNDLIQMVENKLLRIKTLFGKSKLQERPDVEKAEKLLVEIRKAFYK